MILTEKLQQRLRNARGTATVSLTKAELTGLLGAIEDYRRGLTAVAEQRILSVRLADAASQHLRLGDSQLMWRAPC